MLFEEEEVGGAWHCLEGGKKGEWGREVRGYSLEEKEEAAAGVPFG